jgi:hypothetical protein
MTFNVGYMFYLLSAVGIDKDIVLNFYFLRRSRSHLLFFCFFFLMTTGTNSFFGWGS